MVEEKKFQRQTAKICTIQELLKGEYVVQEGWKPNYIQTPSRQLTRVNIIGFIVDKPTPFQFMLDDGTGSILITDFNQQKNTQQLKVGKPVLVVGRPRKANDELFIALELSNTKQMQEQPEWILHRKKELSLIHSQQPNDKIIDPSPELQLEENDQEEENSQNQESSLGEINDELTGDMIVDFVRKKDDGEGCLIQTIIDYFGQEADDLILTLMSMGEVYEIKPGRIKVLE